MMRLSVPDLLAENEELRNRVNAERALADDLADVLTEFWMAGYHIGDAPSVERVLARYREARGR